MAKRELQFDDGKSRKFWTIVLKGKSHTVAFGRTGTKGQTRTKAFGTQQEAKKSYDKLVEQKLGKGYVDTKKQVTASKRKGVRKSKTTRKKLCQGPTPFERLRYNEQFECYETKLTHRGREIEFSICVKDCFPLDDAMPLALKIWKERSKLFRQYKEFASRDQLEMVNVCMEGFDPPSPTLTQKKLEKILAVPSGIRVWMAEKAVFEFFSFSDDLDQHYISVTFDPETYSMSGETRSLF